MRKYRFFLVFLFISLLFVLLPTTAKAELWGVPAGVAPGETFRWVFVTSQLTGSSDPDINYYNWMINEFIMGYAPISEEPVYDVVGKATLGEIRWMAIVSTPTVNAIDNMEPSNSPIFTPLGTLVANNTMDMLDGSILSPININENGDETASFVYTGTDIFGVGVLGLELGQSTEYRGVGYSTVCNGFWIKADFTDIVFNLPIYAISEELTRVPIPGALILAATGLISSTLGLKRLRRKHQE